MLLTVNPNGRKPNKKTMVSPKSIAAFYCAKIFLLTNMLHNFKLFLNSESTLNNHYQRWGRLYPIHANSLAQHVQLFCPAAVALTSCTFFKQDKDGGMAGWPPSPKTAELGKEVAITTAISRLLKLSLPPFTRPGVAYAWKL